LKVLTDQKKSELRRVKASEHQGLNQRLIVSSAEKPVTANGQTISGTRFRVQVNPLGQVGTKVTIGRLSPRVKIKQPQDLNLIASNKIPTDLQQLEEIYRILNQTLILSPENLQQIESLAKLSKPVFANHIYRLLETLSPVQDHADAPCVNAWLKKAQALVQTYSEHPKAA
jgi:hypothetical protein